MARANLICHRALLIGNFTESFEQELVKLRMDRPLLRNVSGIAAYRNGTLFGHADDVGFRVDADPPGLRIIIDMLTDREKRVAHGEYELEEELLCLFVTTSRDRPEDISHLWEEMMEVVPRRRQLHWLHVDASDGLRKQDLDGFWAGQSEVTHHVIKNQTSSEKIHFEDAEWASAILQLQEFLMVQGTAPVVMGEVATLLPAAYGFASIDFSQSDGRRLLHARAFFDVLALEDASIHLDEVFRMCSMALKGGKEAYANARFGIGDPADIDAYFEGVRRFEDFRAAEQMEEFRTQMMQPGGAVDKVTAAVHASISDLADQIQRELNARTATTQQRLTAIRHLLGELGPFTHGKPMLPLVTLHDCEYPSLQAVHTIVQSELDGALDLELQFRSIHQQALLVAGIRDDMRNLEESIAQAELNRLDARAEREALESMHQTSTEAEAVYRSFKSQFHSSRRKLFAFLSSNWLESRVAQIAEESQYTPPPAPEAVAPGLSLAEKRALISSMSVLTISLISSIGTGLFNWVLPLVLWLAVGAFWAVLVYKRTRIHIPHVVDPLFAQRDLWRAKAIELHDLLVSFAAVQRFEDLFDDLIRMPLQQEAMQLDAMLQAFRAHQQMAQGALDSCFTSVRFVEQLGDARTFNQYYNETLHPTIPSAPILFDSMQRQQAAGHAWDPQLYLDGYLDELEEHIGQKMIQLDGFNMVDYLLGTTGELSTPLFLRPGMNDLDELMRKSRIRLEILHNKLVKQDRLVVLHDAQIPQVTLDRFKLKMSEYWEEAKTKQLEFVETDDPNRISFVRLAHITSADSPRGNGSAGASKGSRSASDVEGLPGPLGPPADDSLN